MSHLRFTAETADRIRPLDTIKVYGLVQLVEGVELAPTVARPARIALRVADPNGPLSDLGEVIHLDGGEIVLQSRGTHLDGQRAALSEFDRITRAV